jgi:diaminopimelate epimerase
MRFTKMHGAGNDYVYVDCFSEQVADPMSMARAMSDRHFGVGSDGLILVMPSEVADVRMRMFNADGSEAQMCGNGVRCVAKYAYDHDRAKRNPLRVETVAGIKTISLKLGRDGKVIAATVDMGKPGLEPADLPMRDEALCETPEGYRGVDATRWVEGSGEPNSVVADRFAVGVSMGNPHIVLFCDDVASIPLETLGPRIEGDPWFPQRINVHFVQVHSPNEVSMRTWERGSGITLACGTGASAVCVAGALTGRTEREILAHLPGGNLKLHWRAEDDHVQLTGPAVEVYTGEWPNGLAAGIRAFDGS